MLSSRVLQFILKNFFMKILISDMKLSAYIHTGRFKTNLIVTIPYFHKWGIRIANSWWERRGNILLTFLCYDCEMKWKPKPVQGWKGSLWAADSSLLLLLCAFRVIAVSFSWKPRNKKSCKTSVTALVYHWQQKRFKESINVSSSGLSSCIVWVLPTEHAGGSE